MYYYVIEFSKLSRAFFFCGFGLSNMSLKFHYIFFLLIHVYVLFFFIVDSYFLMFASVIYFQTCPMCSPLLVETSISLITPVTLDGKSRQTLFTNFSASLKGLNFNPI